MIGYEHLEIGRGSGAATVTLARPDVRNALNAALIGEIGRSVEEPAEDGGVRVVVPADEGKHLCVGADIGYMRETARFSYEENGEDARNPAAELRTGEEGQEGLGAFLERREPAWRRES